MSRPTRSQARFFGCSVLRLTKFCSCLRCTISPVFATEYSRLYLGQITVWYQTRLSGIDQLVPWCNWLHWSNKKCKFRQTLHPGWMEAYQHGWFQLIIGPGEEGRLPWVTGSDSTVVCSLSDRLWLVERWCPPRCFLGTRHWQIAQQSVSAIQCGRFLFMKRKKRENINPKFLSLEPQAVTFQTKSLKPQLKGEVNDHSEEKLTSSTEKKRSLCSFSFVSYWKRIKLVLLFIHLTFNHLQNSYVWTLSL